MGELRSFEEVFSPSWPTFLSLTHQPPLPCPPAPGTVSPTPSFCLHPEPQSPDLGPPQFLLALLASLLALSSSIPESDYLAQCPPSAVQARGGI